MLLASALLRLRRSCRSRPVTNQLPQATCRDSCTCSGLRRNSTVILAQLHHDCQHERRCAQHCTVSAAHCSTWQDATQRMHQGLTQLRCRIYSPACCCCSRPCCQHHSRVQCHRTTRAQCGKLDSTHEQSTPGPPSVGRRIRRPSGSKLLSLETRTF